MKPALREFMAGLIDYAGLFPPAALDLGAAVGRYAFHLGSPEAWVLGRFIVPSHTLAELEGELESQGINASWRYSLLVGDRKGSQANLDILLDQGRQYRSFAAGRAGSVGIETMECPLPAEVASTRADLAQYLGELLTGVVTAGLEIPVIYLELPTGCDDELVINALAAARVKARESELPTPMAKLRCGGLTPAAFPAVDRVAAVLAACARAEVPLKCTAGLHHPLRHPAVDLDVMMHGFVNVFGAGMLAHTGRLTPQELQECVGETDREAFQFHDDGFAWRDHKVALEDITSLRRSFLHGFGSCSFAEPITDLRSWGLK